MGKSKHLTLFVVRLVCADMLLKCLTCSSCHFLRVGSVDVTCRRWANKSFRKTVNLPSTNFPLSMKGQRKREIDIQKVGPYI